jgi:hypothetical protein
MNVNRGTKFKIPAPLLCKQYNGEEYWYDETTFDFEEHFQGIWNDASKSEMLLQIYPDNADDVHYLLNRMPTSSIRSILHNVFKRVEQAKRTASGIKQSGSDDAEENLTNCCSGMPASFSGLGGQLSEQLLRSLRS